MYLSDLKHQNQTLEEKLHQLYNLARDKEIDLSFRPPYLDLLSALGNPHLKLPPTIHVAGTNGKGSTIAFLRAIFEAFSYRAHIYTSPHLQKFNERIVLAGRDIDDSMLEPLIDKVMNLNKGRDITFFEITTALAFQAFTEVPADILLLEVGLGGRLDCTNIIESPALTIITPIGMDHQEQLGNKIEQIASEKAGIMKPAVPCIIGPQAGRVLQVLEEKAKTLNVPLYRYGREWDVERDGNQMHFRWADEIYDLPLPNLAGPHQIENVGTALAAFYALHNAKRVEDIDSHTTAEEGKFSQSIATFSSSIFALCKISSKIEQPFQANLETIAHAVQNAKWRARLQNITAHLNMPEGWEAYLDGGHNESAGEALAQQAKAWQAQDPKPLHLFVAMMAHKDPSRFLAPLLPYARSITILPIPGEPKAMRVEALKNILHNANPFGGGSAHQKGEQTSSPLPTLIQGTSFRDELSKIIKNEQASSARILICGSLYLAGHILDNLS